MSGDRTKGKRTGELGELVWQFYQAMAEAVLAILIPQW